MGLMCLAYVQLHASRRRVWENYQMEKVNTATAVPTIRSVRGEIPLAYWAAGFFVAYTVLGWLVYHFPGRFGVNPFIPHAALAIAVLMVCGKRCLPAVFLAVVVVEYFLPIPERTLLAVVLVSAIMTAGYAAISVLLTGRLRIQFELETRRDVARLLFVTMSVMLLCGLAYIGTLILLDIGREGRYWYGVRRFFTGHSVGILIAAPLVFMMLTARRRQEFAAFFRSREAWVHIVVFLAVGWWVFVRDPDSRNHIQNFYLWFLPLVWIATRFGLMGTVIWLVLLQAGLFLMFKLTGYKPQSVFELQLLVLALAITGLLLGVTIDEQRRASADFRESLKLAAAGEMAAAIAHEINQPLTALSNYATAGQLIARAPQPDRTQLTATMSKLLAETQRTAAVVQRLRDFFRTGATQLERVAMGELTENVVQRLRAQAEAANITLVSRVEPSVEQVQADALQIEVVLRNLITNAIDSVTESGAPQGHVGLNVRAHVDGGVLVEVRDSGRGVRSADSERLFASFVTSKTQGMGMGLAISRAIVEAHGGRIWTVPGDTGLFCFTLPQQAAADDKGG